MHTKFLIYNGLLLTWVLLSYASPADPFHGKVPRLGRRDQGITSEYMESDSSHPHEGSLSNFFLKSSKAVPRLGRRKDLPAQKKMMLGEYLSGKEQLFDATSKENEEEIENQLRELHELSDLLNDGTSNEVDTTDAVSELLRKWWLIQFGNQMTD